MGAQEDTCRVQEILSVCLPCAEQEQKICSEGELKTNRVVSSFPEVEQQLHFQESSPESGNHFSTTYAIIKILHFYQDKVIMW